MRKIDRYGRLQCIDCLAWFKPESFKLYKTTVKTTVYEYRVGRCTSCYSANNVAHAKAWKLRNRAYCTQRDLAKRHALRKEFMAKYGHKCTCCSERRYEFLTIEHTNGRVGKKRPPYQELELLARSGWPKTDLQILCFNCNSAKGIYGSCPHTWKNGARQKALNHAQRKALYDAGKAKQLASAYPTRAKIQNRDRDKL
jgi:5-methylcytosine-specific restriction endonuclease McrA